MGVQQNHLTSSQTLAHLSIEVTRRVLLKAHAITLATGTNTSLLGMLNQIEWRYRHSLTCGGW